MGKNDDILIFCRLVVVFCHIAIKRAYWAIFLSS